MQPRYFRRADLVSTPAKGKKPAHRGRYPWSMSTLWRKVHLGEFPAPVRIAGIPCWPIDVLESWEREQLEKGGSK